MNVKGLLTIVIKVLGLLMLPQLFTTISQFLRSWEAFNTERDLLIMSVTYIGFCLATLVLYLLVLRLLIFKTHVLVNKIITPEDNLEDEFVSFKIHRSTVLTICIIVIGGITLVDELPNLIRQIYVYKIETNNFNDSLSAGNFQFIILSVVKVLLGFYLIYNSRFLVNWIEKSRKNNDIKQP